MLIRVGYAIVFEHPAPTPIIAILYLHPSCQSAIRRDEYLLIDLAVQVSKYVDGFGNLSLPEQFRSVLYTGYLGDICLPVASDPIDFSVWFEAYLGDWCTRSTPTTTLRASAVS